MFGEDKSKLIIFGGKTFDNKVQKDLWFYDLQTLNFKEITKY